MIVLFKFRWYHCAVLLIATYLVSGAAYAAPPAVPPCYPMDVKASAVELTLQPSNPIEWLSSADEASFVFTWWCDAKYQWKSYALWGWRRNLDPDWQSVLAMIRTMPGVQVDTLWTAKVKCAADDTTPECASYAALVPIAARQRQAHRPTPIIWAVKSNGTNQSRQVFVTTNTGARNVTPVVNERVAVGVACHCLTKVIEEPVFGADLPNSYCDVTGAPNVATTAVDTLTNRLAWCVRQ